VPLELTAADTKTFLGDGIGLSVSIQVTYIDATGEERRQSFGDMYDCELTKMEINYSLGQGPRHHWIKKEDGPGTLQTEEIRFVTTKPSPESLDPT
jgi:hypothetical protein